MAWYVVWRNPEGEVAGFIEDIDGDDYDHLDALPTKFNTEAEARESMRGHILEPFSEFIEL